MKLNTLHSCSPLILCAAMMLASCGGSGGGDPVQPPAQNPTPTDPGTQNPPPTTNPTPSDPTPNEPAPNTDPYVIEYYGDSTIWGWASGTNGGRVATPAPNAFANALPSTPQNVVRNEGVSGSTSCELLEGGYGSYPAWNNLMQSSDATHVIVNHGINDENELSEERYRYCLTQIAQIARANGKQIVFETPNPVGDDRLVTYVEIMRSVAAAQEPDVPVIDQHAYLMNYLNGRSVGEIAPDGVHPNQETYIMKGEYAAQRFMEIFPR